MAEQILLGGYRVLDLTDEKGLLCGKLLGDFGADVIKIEPPGGDPARNIGPFYKDIPHPEKSLFWFFTNLNKRGITLDIETPDGKQTFKRLVETADFVIESFEPGYMASLGLGYEELEKINPRIIMTSITPFGQTGPYAYYKTTDIVGVAMGGMVRIFGDAGMPPNRISAPQFYFQGGIHGAVGSLVAHYHRELTGEGQHVDVACQQAVVLSLMIAAEFWDLLKVNYKGLGPGIGLSGIYFSRWIFRCKDGYVFIMWGGGATTAFRVTSEQITAMANRDGMMLDFKDFPFVEFDLSKIIFDDEIKKTVDRFVQGLSEFFLTKTKQELFEEALEKSIVLVPLNDARGVLESPQLAARGFWEKVEHPELGEAITYPGFPVKMGDIPYRVQQRAPLIGEHNEDIYVKELGFSKEKLVLLKTRGVI